MRKNLIAVLAIVAVAFAACENSRVTYPPKGEPTYSDAMVNNNAEALKLGDSVAAAQAAVHQAEPAAEPVHEIDTLAGKPGAPDTALAPGPNDSKAHQ